MSSNEDEYNDGDSSLAFLRTLKKRKVQRACDICRRKKIRCDGNQVLGNRCSNCAACSFNCTYVEMAKKRGPLKDDLERLRNRMDNMNKLLRRVCPDELVYQELIASLDSNWTDRPPLEPSALFGDNAMKAQPETADLAAVTSAIRGAMEGNPDITNSPTDVDDPTRLADKLAQMTVSEGRFYGMSSGAMLLRTAAELKNEYAGNGEEPEKGPRREFSTRKSWEKKSNENEKINYIFPDFDLALHCVDLYFKHTNLYLPLLHRPTFEKYVKEGRHETNEDFAAVFLLVCAVGARYSDDPRVLVDGVDGVNPRHSSGWKWYEQVQLMKRSLVQPPTLCDLQLYCLYFQYVVGSSTPQACWTMVGVGIRLAQEVGAHRKKPPTHVHTAEDELWKRAFWVLVCLDRMVSSHLGRPCAIQDEDFDLDLPIDCDDEYWDNPEPEKRFKQPPDKPSLIRYFILHLKLLQILAFALRTIYSINKSQILLGFFGRHWEQHVVAELDSALNKWLDSVPDHLRWDPNRENDEFFNQSATLYSDYYDVQIYIHRPFIPSPSKPALSNFPSLAICTTAARSCTQVLYIMNKRNSNPPVHIQKAAFTAGIVLLLSIWGSKRSGLSTDPKKEMADVYKCMEVLKSSEERWYGAGFFWDILCKQASMGDLPLPQLSPPSGTKRAREVDTPLSGSVSESYLNPMSQDGIPRTIAGSQRVRKEPSFVGQTQRAPQKNSPQHQSQRESITPDATVLPLHRRPSRRQSHNQIQQIQEYQQFTSSISPSGNAEVPISLLPVYSSELANLPSHGQETFSAQAYPSQPQSQAPHQHSETSYWYTMPSSVNTEDNERSEFTSHLGPTEASVSYGLHHPPPMTPQQQQQHYPYHHHASQSIPVGGMSEISTQAQYGMEMETGMIFDMFDAMSKARAFAQQQPATYGSRQMDSSSAGMGSRSMTSPPAITGLPVENVYGRMGDMMPERSGGDLYYQHQYQHQGVLQQQEQQQGLMYSFVGGDAAVISSNAQTVVGLDEPYTHLEDVHELMQGHVHHNFPVY